MKTPPVWNPTQKQTHSANFTLSAHAFSAIGTMEKFMIFWEWVNSDDFAPLCNHCQQAPG
jgi:hypothetical protein